MAKVRRHTNRNVENVPPEVQPSFDIIRRRVVEIEKTMADLEGKRAQLLRERPVLEKLAAHERTLEDEANAAAPSVSGKKRLREE